MHRQTETSHFADSQITEQGERVSSHNQRFDRGNLRHRHRSGCVVKIIVGRVGSLPIALAGNSTTRAGCDRTGGVARRAGTGQAGVGEVRGVNQTFARVDRGHQASGVIHRDLTAGDERGEIQRERIANQRGRIDAVHAAGRRSENVIHAIHAAEADVVHFGGQGIGEHDIVSGADVGQRAAVDVGKRHLVGNCVARVAGVGRGGFQQVGDDGFNNPRIDSCRGRNQTAINIQGKTIVAVIAKVITSHTRFVVRQSVEFNHHIFAVRIAVIILECAQFKVGPSVGVRAIGIGICAGAVCRTNVVIRQHARQGGGQNGQVASRQRTTARDSRNWQSSNSRGGNPRPTGNKRNACRTVIEVGQAIWQAVLYLEIRAQSFRKNNRQAVAHNLANRQKRGGGRLCGMGFRCGNDGFRQSRRGHCQRGAGGVFGVIIQRAAEAVHASALIRRRIGGGVILTRAVDARPGGVGGIGQTLRRCRHRNCADDIAAHLDCHRASAAGGQVKFRTGFGGKNIRRKLEIGGGQHGGAVGHAENGQCGGVNQRGEGVVNGDIVGVDRVDVGDGDGKFNRVARIEGSRGRGRKNFGARFGDVDIRLNHGDIDRGGVYRRDAIGGEGGAIRQNRPGLIASHIQRDGLNFNGDGFGDGIVGIGVDDGAKVKSQQVAGSAAVVANRHVGWRYACANRFGGRNARREGDAVDLDKSQAGGHRIGQNSIGEHAFGSGERQRVIDQFANHCLAVGVASVVFLAAGQAFRQRRLCGGDISGVRQTGGKVGTAFGAGIVGDFRRISVRSRLNAAFGAQVVGDDDDVVAVVRVVRLANAFPCRVYHFNSAAK